MAKEIPSKYKPFPFWSWNDELDEKELVRQIDWMHDKGIGGFFMHARGGLTTPYLGEKWFSCVEACLKRAKELGMEAYAYDENGWPSGFVGGKLLEDEENHDMFLTHTIGAFDPTADLHYDISDGKFSRVEKGENVLNVTIHNSSSTADICNKDVVKKFINLTHEEYKKHDIYGNLRGFFTDEPQYFRWNTPYTRVLPKYFEEKYNEDIFDKLGLLFVDNEGYREFRYKYFKALHNLMLDSFAKQVYEWCDKNNYKLTGHYVEENSLAYQMMCCGGIMPFYEFEHIPGIDYLGRDIQRCAIGKQLGSVACQLGKEQRMVECFACVGWDTTPNELKIIAENLMVNGVNIICHHLLPYSEHGQRKRDYPEHYSSINPWVNKAFKTFNDYFSSRGMMLSKSKEKVNVAMLQPIRSAYLEFKRFICDDNNLFNVGKLDKAFVDANTMLENKHIPFHLLDETLLAKYGSVDNKQFVCGLCKYDYLIIPAETTNLDKETEALFRKYIENGGKILLLGDKPKYLEGVEFDYSYMKSNITIDEILEAQDFLMSETKEIISSYYIDENGNPFLYAVNLGDAVDVCIKPKTFKSLKVDDKIFEKQIHFDKYDSKIIYFSNEKPAEEFVKKPLVLNGEFKLPNKVDNFLLLDNLQFSFDGINYSNRMNYMGAFMLMLNKRYEGDLYLKYVFDVKEIPEHCFALIENTRTSEVRVNGEVANKVGTILEKDLWKYDVAKHLKKGTNEIVVKINFFEKEIVYYALFGENVTESIKNCLAYDTTIEAIYLMGDFGVYGDLEEHDKTYVGDNFYIDKQQDKVITLIKDGFPFFRGNVSLEQEIEVNDLNYEFVYKNRFQLIDLYVNDKFVDRLMFNNKADISKYLVKGKNVIRLDMTISNRNLLGVHHNPVEECTSIGPYSFELVGTWDENGQSPLCLKRYSFVKVL